MHTEWEGAGHIPNPSSGIGQNPRVGHGVGGIYDLGWLIQPLWMKGVLYLVSLTLCKMHAAEIFSEGTELVQNTGDMMKFW